MEEFRQGRCDDVLKRQLEDNKLPLGDRSILYFSVNVAVNHPGSGEWGVRRRGEW